MEKIIVQEIDGPQFFAALSSGFHNVISQTRKLNQINVFPVADGDTGTNLAATFRSAMDLTVADPSVAKTAQNIANSALAGSRGNSGTIFSELLFALAEELSGFDKITPWQWAQAVKKSHHRVHAAIENPKPGTIISVLRDWGEALHQYMLENKEADFSILFQAMVDKLNKLVSHTTLEMPMLQQANVVDSGALALQLWAEGISQYFLGKKDLLPKDSDAEILADLASFSGHHHSSLDQIEYRYCTEALLKGTALNTKEIEELTQGFGDSFAKAGNSTLLKVHVHTNQPQDLFLKLGKIATIVAPKVEDMKIQTEIHLHRKKKVALVTDSACDLPQEFLEKYQIHVVPLQLTFGENTYLDKVTINPAGFYQMIENCKDYPKTSQPNVVSFQNLYNFLLSYYDEVVSIHLSAKLSGTFNSASLAAQKVDSKRIHVIDAKNLSTSMGLVVQQLALYQFTAGEPTAAQLVAKAEKLIARAHILVSVKNLRYMVRGGRVSPVKGLVAKILNVKPIISLKPDGSSMAFGKDYSRSANIRRMLAELMRYQQSQGILSYAIGHANETADAQILAAEVEKKIGLKPEFILDIAPVIGLHAGVGAISLAFLEKEPEN